MGRTKKSSSKAKERTREAKGATGLLSTEKTQQRLKDIKEKIANYKDDEIDYKALSAIFTSYLDDEYDTGTPTALGFGKFKIQSPSVIHDHNKTNFKQIQYLQRMRWTSKIADNFLKSRLQKSHEIQSVFDSKNMILYISGNFNNEVKELQEGDFMQSAMKFYEEKNNSKY